MKDFSGQVLADKYRVDSLMSETGLGDLYRGTHLLMEKGVTIKILPPALAVDPQIANRFWDEAKTLSRISHPNILNVTDTGKDASGAIFLVFENAEGETLEEAIRNEGKFSLERANRIIRQTSGALSVAHVNGIFHHNLTSKNILLAHATSDETGETVKVLNFAFNSASAESGEEGFSIYEAGYVSPEQSSQASEPDARSDVYSLGIILYEMLAGEVPFTGATPNDVMLKQLQEPPLPLSAYRDDLPAGVETVLLTALAKNPDSRFQTPNEMAAALNRAALLGASAAGDAVIRHNFEEQPGQQPIAAAVEGDGDGNNIWKTAFIVLAGIAVLSAFFIYLTQVKQTNPPTQLQTDANGQPVQPVNPPVGSSEQSLSNMGGFAPDMYSNSNMVNGGASMPQILPGGDGYDPWARGGIPPQGAPQQSAPTYIPPTGQYYDANINPGSPFMAPDGYVYVPVPKNTNTNVNTQPTKKTPPANANVQTPPTTENPASTPPPANTTAPAETKPTPAPKNTKPTPKPSVQPKGDTTQQSSTSGK